MTGFVNPLPYHYLWLSITYPNLYYTPSIGVWFSNFACSVFNSLIYKVALGIQVLLSDETIIFPLPRSLPATMNKKDPFLMPWYQIRLVADLSREADMDSDRFLEFRRIVISSANMHLNCDRRPEEQDINALERFMKTVHDREPSISNRFEESWPVMAYLEIYLVGRIRQNRYLNRRYGYRKRFVNCPDPIWVRYAEVRTTGRFRRNCRREDRRRARTPLRLSPFREPPSMHIQRTFKRENRASTPCESVYDRDNEDEVSQSDNSATAIVECESDHISPTDPLVDFLVSVRPNLLDFQSHFIDMGLTNAEAIDAFLSWPIDVQENTMRMQFTQVMNVIQLTGLLVTLRERQSAP